MGEHEDKCCLNNSTLSLALMISQMYWIVTHFDNKNTNQAVYCFYAIFVGFSLLGKNGYKCCLNTAALSLTLMISQMHWIVTHFDHRKANKAIYYF